MRRVPQTDGNVDLVEYVGETWGYLEKRGGRMWIRKS